MATLQEVYSTIGSAFAKTHSPKLRQAVQVRIESIPQYDDRESILYVIRQVHAMLAGICGFIYMDANEEEAYREAVELRNVMQWAREEVKELEF